MVVELDAIAALFSDLFLTTLVQDGFAAAESSLDESAPVDGADKGSTRASRIAFLKFTSGANREREI